MIYGYVRVSTAHQNVENGRFEIANFAQKSGFSIDKWVTEQISSTKDLKKRKLEREKKKLQEMLNGGAGKEEIAKALGVGVASLYRFLRR